jgi:thymidylate synthase
MLVLTADSANELFVTACAAVLAAGTPVAPRGIPTREVLGVHLCLTNPQRRFVDVAPIRVLNPAFAAAEAVWILSGSDDPWIYDYNDALSQFANDGILMGAYGPRLRRWGGAVDQLDHVRQLLLRDPDTRQAVIQLFNPLRDYQGYRDVPCTLGYRFYLRQGSLHMHTSMRSQDLWLGFGYDIFAATLLQELLAGWLGVGLGQYHHQVDSLHLYDTVLDEAGRLPRSVSPGVVIVAPSTSWARLDTSLESVIAGEVRDCGSGWSEYATMMHSYRTWKTGNRAEARRIAESHSGVLTQALNNWYDHLEARAALAAGTAS